MTRVDRLTIPISLCDSHKLSSCLDVEKALDEGRLFVLVRTGSYWKMRRNGVTKTWKRDPNRFSIPYKAGMYVYGRITSENMNDFEVR